MLLEEELTGARRLSGKHVGLLINFNVALLKQRIVRKVPQ
jgi:hypothetical protein